MNLIPRAPIEPGNDNPPLTFPPVPPLPTMGAMVSELENRLRMALEQLEGKPLRRLEFKAILMGVVMDFLEEAR